MIKEKFTHIAILLIALGSIASCSDNDGAAGAIIGTWKLEKIESSGMNPSGPQTWDYSGYNIVYQFKTGGILTVSVDSNSIPDYYGSYTVGNHTYAIVDDKEGYGTAGLPYGLKIGNSTFWYKLSSKELVIDSRPLDGGAYYLTKLD